MKEQKNTEPNHTQAFSCHMTIRPSVIGYIRMGVSPEQIMPGTGGDVNRLPIKHGTEENTAFNQTQAVTEHLNKRSVMTRL